MKRILLTAGAAVVFALAAEARAESINILMEGVPDTEFVQKVVPEFEQQTGIDVNIEVVNYAEMHTKLVPQLVAPKGSYSVLVVDFYWVGEFTKAKWLKPLDDLIARDHVDTSVYIPALMDLVGRVDGVTYMLPFYNYAMGLTYRKDLLADARNQAEFKARYGMDLKVPTDWEEYLKQVEFFTKKPDFYGVVNQGLRPDPIAMEWSNYLFARGGRYHDEKWRPTLATPEGIRALEDYKRNIQEFGPLGAASFSFDEAFNVMAQGKAYSYLTYNIFRAVYDDPAKSSVVGKVEIAPVPGGGLNGAWGWAIPNSSPNPEAAWTFLKWVESSEVAKKRAAQGGAPTRTDVFGDPELNQKFPYYPQLQELLATSHNFPVFTYTPALVEVLGRELSLAVAGEKSPEAALKAIDEGFADLARKDGKLQE